jgi:hypothetical protein
MIRSLNFVSPVLFALLLMGSKASANVTAEEEKSLLDSFYAVAEEPIKVTVVKKPLPKPKYKLKARKPVCDYMSKGLVSEAPDEGKKGAFFCKIEIGGKEIRVNKAADDIAKSIQDLFNPNEYKKSDTDLKAKNKKSFEDSLIGAVPSSEVLFSQLENANLRQIHRYFLQVDFPKRPQHITKSFVESAIAYLNKKAFVSLGSNLIEDYEDQKFSAYASLRQSKKAVVRFVGDKDLWTCASDDAQPCLDYFREVPVIK